jgi:large subunit ribosomal protein L29
MMAEEDIRVFPTEEIQARLNDAREELMRLRFQLSSGELTDYTRLRITRRKIARMLTILRERQLAASMEGEQ